VDSVSKDLFKIHLCLAQNFYADDWVLTDHIKTEKVLHTVDDVKSRHCRNFVQLHKVQHPPGPSDKRTVISLSGLPLEEKDSLALSKGQNYAVALVLIPIKDILCGVENAI
jgi:hypothetical protein